jgi:hypothetical protein
MHKQMTAPRQACVIGVGIAVALYGSAYFSEHKIKRQFKRNIATLAADRTVLIYDVAEERVRTVRHI